MRVVVEGALRNGAVMGHAIADTLDRIEQLLEAGDESGVAVVADGQMVERLTQALEGVFLPNEFQEIRQFGIGRHIQERVFVEQDVEKLIFVALLQVFGARRLVLGRGLERGSGEERMRLIGVGVKKNERKDFA